jgi:hypothetical protein
MGGENRRSADGGCGVNGRQPDYIIVDELTTISNEGWERLKALFPDRSSPGDSTARASTRPQARANVSERSSAEDLQGKSA